jgi:hypothetical protein
MQPGRGPACRVDAVGQRCRQRAALGVVLGLEQGQVLGEAVVRCCLRLPGHHAPNLWLLLCQAWQHGQQLLAGGGVRRLRRQGGQLQQPLHQLLRRRQRLPLVLLRCCRQGADLVQVGQGGEGRQHLPGWQGRSRAGASQSVPV